MGADDVVAAGVEEGVLQEERIVEEPVPADAEEGTVEGTEEGARD